MPLGIVAILPPATKFGKVMFSHVFVCPRGGRVEYLWCQVPSGPWGYLWFHVPSGGLGYLSIGYQWG